MILPIPAVSHCSLLTFIWPKHLHSAKEQCQCSLVSSGVFSFDSCAESCDSEYDVQLTSTDLVVFQNVSSDARKFIVHFVCDEEQSCLNGSCFYVTIVASHHIIIIAGIFCLYTAWG